MGAKKVTAMDTIIIEHLACLEINNLILQPPFHLVSNIQWNDKGLSFDGDIDVYSHQKLEKSNFISKVPVQVKGTTTNKKIHKKDKIKHPVNKADLEVYYKNAKGVLYFVVTINPATYEKQAYYRILAPLDLKSLLSELEINGNNSITLTFKKMEKDYLESICKTVIGVVEKQPKHYIEASKKTEFTNYKLDFFDVKEDVFDFFEENAYIYGFSPDNIEMPVEVAKIMELRKENTEVVRLNDEEINVIYHITETENKYKVVIENTLTFDLDKKTKSGNLHLGRLRTLGSYVKCLRLINYYIEHNKLPFQYFEAAGRIDKKEKFQGIEEKIKSYKELIEVCGQIGINENYLFNDEENLQPLFNGIIDVFKNKQYDLLKFHNQGKLEDTKLIHIDLSKYVKVRLIYTNDRFINFYSEEALTTIRGLMPKEDIVKNNGQKKVMPISFPDNWEEYYQKVSFYMSEKIEEMVGDTNFNFEVVKLSFTDEFHDIQANMTINVSLKYISYYDKSRDEKYLELALDLNQRYLVKFPKDDFAKVNIYLIKLKQYQELSEEEQADVLDIQERAEINKNQSLRFACEVLLQSKVKAQRIFRSLDDKEKERMIEFPIYHFYENLD
ncbi:DUF4365 domain-containing protein [Metabacillus fastidiosus]|uniref:DUF4365 domain-containing protein n=1 Tax=Metabacillus fastidiosus TaxID=1458 RepID=UPI002DC00137|nr:DUF4365 domain-containing protein [Metabacillus fastidiosus]MEC2078519.1 DUF4365 domain-containing protein [Metabacillus fastidiosus]